MEIKNRFTGDVIFGADVKTMRECVELAVKQGANLSGADLSRADLRGADLRGANLSRAILSGAILSGANLSGADLLCAGNMNEIKTLQFEKWHIGYTSDVLQIGCQSHSIEKWKKWDTEAGRKWIAMMDNDATEWAEKYLDIVLKLIELSPATKHAAAQR